MSQNTLTIEDVLTLKPNLKSWDFFINGDDDGTVTTRTNRQYPTVKKALRLLFELGGLPATPFDTLIQAEEESLEVGALAIVLNESLPDKNGLYRKTSDGLKKTVFGNFENFKNTLLALEQRIDSLKGNKSVVIKDDPSILREGHAVIADKDGDVLSPYRAERRYIQLRVSGYSVLKTTGLRDDKSDWKWVYTDAFLNRIKTGEDSGNTNEQIPPNAVYALRTVRVLEDPETGEDLDALKFVLYPSISINEIRLLLGTGLTNLNIGYASGMLTETLVFNDLNKIDGLLPNPLPISEETAYYGTAISSLRSCLEIPVETGDFVMVEGAAHNEDFPLVFGDSSKKSKVADPVFTENGVMVPVPSEAAFVSKGMQSSSVNEAVGTKITVFKANPTNAVISIVDGSVPETSRHENSAYAPGYGRKHIELDVRNRPYFEVLETSDTFQPVWVFLTNERKRLEISSYKGTGVFKVPANAVYAIKGIRVDADRVDDNLSIRLAPRTTFPMVLNEITELRDALASIKNKLLLLNTDVLTELAPYYVRKMEKDFENGNILNINDFEGETSEEKIRNGIAFIEKRGHGILDFVDGHHYISAALELPSNCWLYLNNATVQLADGTHDNLIRNKSINVPENPYEMKPADPAINIRVFGASGGNAKLLGADIPYSAPHPINGGEAVPWVGDAYGWRTIGILFANVKHYELHDFSLEKVHCWSISQESGCQYSELFNLNLENRVKNGDGIDFRFGCSHSKVYNITGDTGDDLIALTSLPRYEDDTRTYPDGRYIFPMQVSGVHDQGHGTAIHHIDISNVSGASSHQGIRILAGNAGKVHDVNITKVRDSGRGFLNPAVVISSGYGTIAPMGALRDISIHDVKVSSSPTAVRLRHNIKDVVINKITQNTPDGVKFDDTSNKQNVTITNS